MVDQDFDGALDVESSRRLGGNLAASARKSPQAAQRRGALAAQAMSSAALVLALISICLLSFVALRLGGGSGGGAGQPSLHDVIGLAGARAAGASDVGGEEKGWYKTYLRTMVREDEALDSPEVQLVPPGALVWVAETKGRRARVLKPFKGWMSLRSAEGIEIMRPDTTYDGKADDAEFYAALNSPEMKNATKRLKDASAKLTALQAKMQRSVKRITDKELYRKGLLKTKQVGSAVQKKAPELEKLAAQELKKVINTKGTHDLLKGLAKQPGMQEITKGAQADAMAMQDVQRLQSHFEGSLGSSSSEQASVDGIASAAVAAAADDSAMHA